MYQRRLQGVDSDPSPRRARESKSWRDPPLMYSQIDASRDDISPEPLLVDLRHTPPPQPFLVDALDHFLSQINPGKPVNKIHVASQDQSRNPITSTPTDPGPSDSTGHRPVIYNHYHHSSRNIGSPPPSSIQQSASQQQAPYNNSNVSEGGRMDNARYLRVPYPQHPNTLPPLSPFSHRHYPSAPSFPPPLTRPQQVPYSNSNVSGGGRLDNARHLPPLSQSTSPQHPNTLPPLSPLFSHRPYPSAPSFPPPLTRPQRPNTVSPLSLISQFDLSGKVDQGKQVSWGSYSDIWCGTLLIGKKTVAIKTLRVKQSSNRMSKTPLEERLQKRFFREILLWAKLRHPNIVPLLGYAMLSDGVPSIVSPWYPNGNLKEYLELNPKAGRHSLVNDVAKALSYLHSISVVHGDIKAENVLIDAEGVASLCDFGLSQFLDEAVRITGFTTTQANTGGTDRYLCPELLEEDKKTTMSDMWAFACLIMLILTDEIPHARVTSRAMVFNAILRGTHPYTKPDKPIKESLWSSVVKCWSISPVDRPSASDMESLILLEILVENNSSSQTEVVTAQPSASSLSSDTSPSSSSDPPVMSSIKTPEFPPPAVLNYPITSKGLGMDDILPKPSTKVPVDTILTGPTIVPGWAVPPHVLLVDDDSARRKLYSRFLRVCGCTIDVAVDGVGAVNKVNLEKYDLVLMDIIMPKLDGVSATSLIRQFDDTTPIISMTNNLKPNEVSTYISNGMNDILPTPFTKENLFTMLEKHLGHLKQQTSKPYIDTSDPSSSKQLLNGMMEDQYSTMMLHRLLGGNSGVTDAFDGVAIETNAMRNTLKRGLEEVDDDGTTGKRGRFEVLE